MRRWWTVLGLAVALAACGSEGGALAVEDAWGRPSPAVADAAAFYAVVSNPGDTADRLVSASSERCGMTEIHETSMDDAGVMSMRPAAAEALVVPAGGGLVLEPGGLHVMCMQVTSPLAEGETIPLRLVFEQAGEVDVDVVVENRE
jgi:copper(I)-binding protein